VLIARQRREELAAEVRSDATKFFSDVQARLYPYEFLPSGAHVAQVPTFIYHPIMLSNVARLCIHIYIYIRRGCLWCRHPRHPTLHHYSNIAQDSRTPAMKRSALFAIRTEIEGLQSKGAMTWAARVALIPAAQVEVEVRRRFQQQKRNISGFPSVASKQVRRPLRPPALLYTISLVSRAPHAP